MKQSFLYFALLAVSLASEVAQANATESGRITQIVLEDHVVSVWLSGTDDTTDCAGGGRWTLLDTDTLFKEKYAALLGAAHAGLTVSLMHLGGNGCGNWTSNKIYYVAPVY